MMPSRILVRGVNWLGDAVMTTPALLRLREAVPSARIAILTAPPLADLYRGHPALDEVVSTAPASPWATGRALREHGFEVALILPNSPRSALECWWARIPRRVGYARGLRRWWLTDPVPPRPGSARMHKPGRREIADRLAGRRPVSPLPPEAHHLFDYLHLAGRLGARVEPLAPRLWVEDAEVASVRGTFQLDGDAVWLGLNPGAEYGPAKRWPSDRFVAAAREVSARRPVRWILFGGRRDEAVAASIAGQLPGSVNLAGRTTLRQLLAALRVCRVLLTNDTGPMHVAAALGVPVVVPFGSTSPELTGPGMPGTTRHRWLRSGAACAPCFLRECPIDFRCLLGIEPAEVAAAVIDVLTVPPGPEDRRREGA